MRQNKIVIILLIAIGLSIYVRFGLSDMKSRSPLGNNSFHPYLHDITNGNQSERMAEYWAKDIVKNGKLTESEEQKAKQLYADCIRNEAIVFIRMNSQSLSKIVSTDYITFMTGEFEKRCESTVLALMKDLEEKK